MSRFVTPLNVELIDDATWRLAASLVYYSEKVDVWIVVPRGFITDFASVPRLPLAFQLFGDTAHQAAVVHDYLYSEGSFDRLTADSILLEAMGVSGISVCHRYLMYWAVRIFGGSRFEKR